MTVLEALRQATSSTYYHSGNANREKNTTWYIIFPLEQLPEFDILQATLLYNKVLDNPEC